MPAPGFFQQLGLFVVPNFLDRESGAELCRKIAAAPAEPAGIVTRSGEDRFDEDIRKVDSRILPKEHRAGLKQRLRGLIPDLQKHFGMALADCEPLQFLIYHPGYFFKPHRDGGHAGNNEETRQRRVSVVIFLNRESQEPAENAYGQGQLTFYALLDGPQWERCKFSLNAEPGLLIAFPSDKLHEVTPVLHGQRFTVVTWFYAPDLP
jgi:SM-20-related protein